MHWKTTSLSCSGPILCCSCSYLGDNCSLTLLQGTNSDFERICPHGYPDERELDYCSVKELNSPITDIMPQMLYIVEDQSTVPHSMVRCTCMAHFPYYVRNTAFYESFSAMWGVCAPSSISFKLSSSFWNPLFSGWRTYNRVISPSSPQEINFSAFCSSTVRYYLLHIILVYI